MACHSILDLQELLRSRIASALGIGSADAFRLADPPNPERGEIAIACHAAAKQLGTPPPHLAERLSKALEKDADFDVVGAEQGYVNVRIRRPLLLSVVTGQVEADPAHFGRSVDDPGAPWLIEFSGPNTNKPLHIGHLRNTILGASLSHIVDLCGHRVIRYNIINDRGIHICKSMVAYRRFGGDATPQSAGIKGDQFVGRHYSLFASKVAEEFELWTQNAGHAELEAFQFAQRSSLAVSTDTAMRTRFLTQLDAQGMELPFKPRKTKPAEYAVRMKEAADLEERYQSWLAERGEERREVDRVQALKRFMQSKAREYEADISELHREARETLVRWEENDPGTRDLWRTMNDWVLAGIEQTYQRLGVRFDHVDYESEVYLLGKEVVGRLLKLGVARRRTDGAVVYDQPSRKPGEPTSEKVLLRADGTSVYITQDLGSLLRRFERHDPGRVIYVVGSEQELHFETLFGLVERLSPGLGRRCEHLSYGMVELPHGKMKSREGEIIEADGFLDDVHKASAAQLRERNPALSEAELEHRAEVISLAAVKFYLLKFGKRSTVQFDVDSALDMNGKTGPYCMYAVARIRSILRKIEQSVRTSATADGSLMAPEEAGLLFLVGRLPEVVATAARETEPLHVAEFCYRLAKAFNSYYTAAGPEGRALFPVVQCPDPSVKALRIKIIELVAQALVRALECLGIDTLDEM